MKIVSVAQMRALEAAAFASGITEAALQERAGHAVAQEVFRLLKPGERVVVLVGHGNNGRDGAVAAEWLLGRRVPIDLVLAPRHAIAAHEIVRLQEHGAATIAAHDQPGVEAALRGAGMAVDALAGIGVSGALREPLASLARQVNDARNTGLRVLALDIPSGIDSDTGAVEGEAIWADYTVSLGGVKQGLLRFPAAEHVGKLLPTDIGIPSSAAADLPYTCLDTPDLAPLVPPRPLSAHKYGFGRVLVVAGADHYLGAAVLCSGGALRVGAGLVTLASTREARRNTAAHLPEVTYTTTDVRAADGPEAARSLETYLHSHPAALIGPGLGRGQGTTEFVAAVLRQRPGEYGSVIDADGLFALAEIPKWPELLGPNVVLTPHAGELERLVGHQLATDEAIWIQAGRLAQQWGCVLVAKGPFTCIANPDGRVDVWPRANPALATGGTGDVLAGVTAGLIAQGLGAWDASRLAVGVHGLAAERIVENRQWRTLLASDLLPELPAVVGSLAALTAPR